MTRAGVVNTELGAGALLEVTWPGGVGLPTSTALRPSAGNISSTIYPYCMPHTSMDTLREKMLRGRCASSATLATGTSHVLSTQTPPSLIMCRTGRLPVHIGTFGCTLLSLREIHQDDLKVNGTFGDPQATMPLRQRSDWAGGSFATIAEARKSVLFTYYPGQLSFD